MDEREIYAIFYDVNGGILSDLRNGFKEDKELTEKIIEFFREFNNDLKNGELKTQKTALVIKILNDLSIFVETTKWAEELYNKLYTTLFKDYDLEADIWQ